MPSRSRRTATRSRGHRCRRPNPRTDDLFWDLRDQTRGTDGEAWDVVLVKIHRNTATLVMNFVSGDAADMWRVTPENMAHLPESLRPRPEDFEAI